MRQDRYLDRRPPEPGVFPVVFEASRLSRAHFVAAIPYGTDWWEGPLRRDVDRAVDDLFAEQAFRAGLAEAAS